MTQQKTTDGEGFWVRLPKAILARKGIRAGAQVAYAVLADYAGIDGNGTCWPGIRRLAADMAVCVSTAHRRVEALRAAGLIAVEVGTGSASNRYTMCVNSELSVRKTRTLETKPAEASVRKTRTCSVRKTRTNTEQYSEQETEVAPVGAAAVVAKSGKSRAEPAKPTAEAVPDLGAKRQALKAAGVEEPMRSRFAKNPACTLRLVESVLATNHRAPPGVIVNQLKIAIDRGETGNEGNRDAYFQAQNAEAKRGDVADQCRRYRDRLKATVARGIVDELGADVVSQAFDELIAATESAILRGFFTRGGPAKASVELADRLNAGELARRLDAVRSISGPTADPRTWRKVG